MLLRSCPERLYFLLVIGVTHVTGVGVNDLEPVLHQAQEVVERFHQRVMLLFAGLAVGVAAAFLLELFDGWLNFRALLLDQNTKRKRAHITDPAQQRRSHDHHRRFRLRIHGPSKSSFARKFLDPNIRVLRRAQRIGYAMHSSRSHHAVIRVYDDAGNVIETHEHKGDFKEC
jgi:hypothetical protein